MNPKICPYFNNKDQQCKKCLKNIKRKYFEKLNRRVCPICGRTFLRKSKYQVFCDKSTCRNKSNDIQAYGKTFMIGRV